MSAQTKHFKNRLNVLQAQQWDLEFQLAKMRKLREGMRQQYDRVNEQLQLAKNQLETERAKPDANADVMKSFEDIVNRHAPDCEYLKQQLAGMDAEIEGENNPPDRPSIVSRIEAAKMLRDMMNEYVKTL